MGFLAKFLRIVDTLSDRTGAIFSFLVLFIALIIGWEVLVRYVFDNPTKWAHETSLFLFGGYFVFGGAYALRWGAHVNVDFIYKNLSPRGKAILDLFTWLLFYAFLGVLAWKSAPLAWASVARLEHSPSPWRPPIWPVKLSIPIAAILILLQGTTKTIKDVYTAITGRNIAT